MFSVGLHPVGARWIQEHYLVHSPQETYSYYGPLNRVAFNVGYHNEHHDFPSIPWNRLPAVRSLAARQYDSLVAHRSWTRLLLRFLFDRQLLLFSRMTRTYPGLVAHPHKSYEPEQEVSRGIGPPATPSIDRQVRPAAPLGVPPATGRRV